MGEEWDDRRSGTLARRLTGGREEAIPAEQVARRRAGKREFFIVDPSFLTAAWGRWGYPAGAGPYSYPIRRRISQRSEEGNFFHREMPRLFFLNSRGIFL